MLTVLGISHKTAPLAIRERMSFVNDDLELALASLKKLGKDAEYLILSTCNRTEIYTTLDDMTVLLHWLGDYQEISVQDLSLDTGSKIYWPYILLFSFKARLNS